MLRLSWLAILLSGSALAEPQLLELAVGGRSLLPVVVAPGASPRVKRAADDLASYLGRMAGSRFEVVVGDGTRGIAVGVAGSFPALHPPGRLLAPTPTELENYSLQTRAGSASIVGASDTAVEHGVWDFLHRLGYRQFFPGPRWEVVPRRPELSARMEVDAAPSYRSRRIWYGHGPWDYAAEPYREWTVRNRTAGGVDLQTGHAYGEIILALKTEFEQHPEYYPLIDGKRKPGKEAKLCIGNEELRRLVVAYQVEKLKKRPDLASVSVDPSDGGGWCDCEKCRTLGSISDRVVILANEVAAAVGAASPGKLVGMYAYNHHSPAPSVKVAPNVVVSVATAFLHGDQTVEQIMDGWGRQGAVLGVREYYSVNTWDRDQPAQARGADLAYLARTIPTFHQKGARFMSAEASDNWGPNGLGYYIASRLLWDVKDAENIPGLVEDFLSGAFGAAKEPMREFYEQLDTSQPHLHVDDQIGRMFRSLSQARHLAASDANVHARLDDLVQYVHFVFLYQRYARAGGPERQLAFEQLIRHAYRMRETMLVHAKALYRDLPLRDNTISVPAEAGWNVPEGKNPWKSAKRFEPEELEAMVREGVYRHSLAAPRSAPREFSGSLVPLRGLHQRAKEIGGLGPARGVQNYLLHLEAGPGDIQINASARAAATGGSTALIRINAWKVGSITEPESALVVEAVPTDGAEHALRLSLVQPGLYNVSIDSGSVSAEFGFPGRQPVVAASTIDSPMNDAHEHWMGYFYVPKGTTTFGLYGGEHGEVQDSQGRTVLWLNARSRGYHTVAVPAEEDGTVWRIRYARGAVRLLDIPSYFAPDPTGLLVPIEALSQ